MGKGRIPGEDRTPGEGRTPWEVIEDLRNKRKIVPAESQKIGDGSKTFPVLSCNKEGKIATMKRKIPPRPTPAPTPTTPADEPNSPPLAPAILGVGIMVAMIIKFFWK